MALKAAGVAAGVLMGISAGVSGPYVVSAIETRHGSLTEAPMGEVIASFPSLFASGLKRAALGWKLQSELQRVKDDCENFPDVQQETLRGLLKKHNSCQYGKDYAFNTISTMDEFRQMVPISQYGSVQEYVDRMWTSQSSGLLTCSEVTAMAVPSDAVNYYIAPWTAATSWGFQFEGFFPLWANVFQSFPALEKSMQNVLRLYYPPQSKTAPSGPPTGNLVNSKSSVSGYLDLLPQAIPALISAKLSSDAETASYLQLLFALKDKSLGAIEAQYSSTVYHVMWTLENRWKDLVQDIRDGSCSAGHLKLTLFERESIRSALIPDPQRAKELQSIFESGFHCCDGFGGGQLARKVWPSLHCIVASDFEQKYVNRLRLRYCRGIPLHPSSYRSSFGQLGMPIGSNSSAAHPKYVLAPRSQLYEFVPMSSVYSDKTVLASELQEGKEYELVVSNDSGSWRRRTGDIVEHTGWMGKAPVISFKGRRKLVLSHAGERITQRQIIDTMSELASTSQIPSLGEFTIYMDQSPERVGRYRAALEFENATKPGTAAALASLLDENLKRRSGNYAAARQAGKLECPIVDILESGGFERFRSFQASKVNLGNSKIPEISTAWTHVNFLRGLPLVQSSNIGT